MSESVRVALMTFDSSAGKRKAARRLLVHESCEWGRDEGKAHVRPKVTGHCRELTRSRDFVTAQLEVTINLMHHTYKCTI